MARGPSKPMFMSLDRTSSTSALVGRAGALVVAVLGVAPGAEAAAVVEDRLAVEGELHLAVHAAHHAQQDVRGVVVGRRPALGLRARVLVPPWADEHHVPHDDPAARRAPAGLEHHGAGQVASRGRHVDVGRSEAEAAGIAVEDRCRRRWASRCAAGRATRRCRWAPPAPSSRSPTGRRTRRWAGRATGEGSGPARGRRDRSPWPFVVILRSPPALGGDSLTRSSAAAKPSRPCAPRQMSASNVSQASADRAARARS